MFTLNIDLGQVLLGLTIGTVGYFMKRMIDQFEKRIDVLASTFSERLEKHENVLFGMNGDIQAIIGKLEIERRRNHR